MSEPFLGTVQIFLPESHPRITPVDSHPEVECDTAESETISTNHGRRQVNTGEKRQKKKRRLLEAGGEGSHHRPYFSKKSEQIDINNTCAHLHPLQDYLQPGLDVVFCGINPGRKSAETGHHFANPTNHFWRCLHQSGLTATLVPPTEDFSLPEKYNIGLTNLVDRPSTQACELSRTEMIASVPTFLDKLARHRPRFVCFVGVIIWEIVRNSLVKLLQQGAPTRVGKEKNREKNRMGLQTYKVVHGNTVAGLPEETLFFVVPCTSGRVVQYQLPDKIRLFTELQTLIKMLSSEIDTSGMDRIFWRSGSS